MVYDLWLYVPTFMVKLAVFGQQVRAKMKLVSILARKYSFVNYFSVKGERKFVYFSNFFKTFGEFFFVKGTFSCESAVCINKSVNKLFPEKVKFKKKEVSRQISTGQNSTDIFLQTFFYHDIFLPERHFSTKTFFYQDLFLPLHFSTDIFLPWFFWS